MENVFSALNDLLIIIFDIILYMKIVSFRWNSRKSKAVLFLLCGTIVAAYFTAAYVFMLPASLASLLFVTIPSFWLFYVFSAHRDSRFVLSFCLVDTVSLIIAFISQYLFIETGVWGGILSTVVILFLFLLLLYAGRSFFETYHRLLETAQVGWGGMAFATALIYFAMIFFTVYPEPMADRLEYAITWLVFALVVLACYYVFIQSILKTKRILEQNLHLEYEKKIFLMAYTDALTGLKNRAAYTEVLDSTERLRPLKTSLCCVVLDLNKFKNINDTFGHAVGDAALKSTAICLKKAFSDLDASIFRVGGDEFYLLLKDVTEEVVEKRLAVFDDLLLGMGNELSLYLTSARGYAFVPDDPSVSLEDVFNLADKAMYENKRTSREYR